MEPKAAAARLGVFPEEGAAPDFETANTHKNDGPVGAAARLPERGAPAAPDYFVTRDGLEYAGTHLLADLWGGDHLSDVAAVERALLDAAEAAGATVLHAHLHRFGPDKGVSGVVLLAESHISIHTWPERGYAAVDIFMCGGCDPFAAMASLKRAFRPDSLQLSEQKRGLAG